MMKLLRRHKDWLMIVIAILAIPFVFYFVQRPDYGAMGLGDENIEELVRDELSLNEIKRLLAAGITISKGELDENFQRGYDKFYVTIIRFRSPDFNNGITVNDEDVQKYYDAHKAELKTDEKRKVQFVQLGLTEEQKKLTGKERIEPLQKLSDRATDFTQALLEGADFQQVAGKFQLPVRETGEFTAAAPDPQLKADPQLGAAAFKLSAQEPNSDPIQVADGFYILHLTGITEARALTVEEAKPKIVEAMKKSRAREVMSTKGAEVMNQLREARKPSAGAGLEAAIQKAGVKFEKIPPFALIEEEKTKLEGKERKNERHDLAAIKDAVAFLNPGEISDFVPSGENGFIAVLEKREPSADANAGEKKAAFEKRLLDNKQRIVFFEWLRDRQQAAGLQFSKG